MSTESIIILSISADKGQLKKIIGKKPNLSTDFGYN